MGWCSGTEMSIQIYDLVREYIPEEKRKDVSKILLKMFMDADADCYEGESDLERDSGVLD